MPIVGVCFGTGFFVAYPSRNSNNRHPSIDDCVVKEDYSNGTVAPSVRSNLTAVMGRIAGYRQGEVIWKEMISAAERFPTNRRAAEAESERGRNSGSATGRLS